MSNHTIVVRPASDFEPHIDGIVNHAVQIADGAEIITESTDYLRRLGEALIARADRVDGTLSPTLSTPTESVTESAELQHPGTWLPGDQFVDSDGDLFEREPDGLWRWDGGSHVRDDETVDAVLEMSRTARITHLVPRTDEASE